MRGTTQLSLFTKPWPGKTIGDLGVMVHRLGFDGVELPVRSGFPVNPDNIAKALPAAVKTLAKENVVVFSIAGAATQSMVEACADAGVPTIRIMAPIGAEGYLEAERRLQREFDRLAPTLERHGVRIGVQNHSGRYICNASGLRSLLTGYNSKQFAAVWDAAHNALQGEEPELALEIVGEHLCMVNLKNAVWRRKNAQIGPGEEWTPYWTPGREGLASWPRVAAELRRKLYGGVVCLTAEYSEEARVDEFVAEDLTFARSLFP